MPATLLLAALLLGASEPNSYEGLALPPGAESAEALAVSADGETAVGFAFFQTGGRAVRWSGGKAELLEVPEGFKLTTARGVSADGRVIVGFGRNLNDREVPLKWSAEGVRKWRTTGVVDAVSDDGSMVIGTDADGNGLWWERTDGIHRPEMDRSGLRTTVAVAASADADVIVGYGDPAASKPTDSVTLAFRYRRVRGTFEILATPTGPGRAYVGDVSADGTIVVGTYGANGPRRVVLWDARGRAEELFAAERKAGWEPDTFTRPRLDATGETVLATGRGKDRVKSVYLWRRGRKVQSLSELLPVSEGCMAMDFTKLPDGRYVIVGRTEGRRPFRAIVNL